eukprot:15443800-Alexandrium_andersonii.AAC.1
MSGGLPEGPPGLEPGAPRLQRSRSAGATPSMRTSSDVTNGCDFTYVFWALGHSWRWPACAWGPGSAAKPG